MTSSYGMTSSYDPPYFTGEISEARAFLNAKFPSLAFHFFGVVGQPDKIAVRVMPASNHHHTGFPDWPYAKRGLVGGQQLWEVCDCKSFPDEAFLIKCMLIA